jgi:predicted Zn-dependent protease
MSARERERPPLGEDECRAIGERALRVATADEALVRIERRLERTTRFAANAVSFNAATERVQVTARVAFGPRAGAATVESTEDDALRAVVRRAEEAAREAPPDPEFLPFLGPQAYAAPEAWCPETAALDGAEQVRPAGDMIEAAREAGCAAAGTVETGASVVALLSSRGLFACHARTDAEIGCTVTAPDSSGWARRREIDIRRLDARALAAEAIDIARRSAAPRELPPGRYTTLLRPAAVADLLPMLPWLSDVRRTDEGLTFLSGREGERLVPETIRLASDPADPRFPTQPFDAEGLPQRPRVWIESGRFRDRVCDRWTAQRSAREAVPYPWSFVMEGTSRSLEDLVGEIERGVLFTRLWYIRPVKLEETLFTGMTRDGTFLIEDGRIAGGVRSLRFNDSVLGMLQRTVAIGRSESCSAEGACLVFPPLVVRDWEFVSATGM